MKCLATFDTTHMALMFENICRTAGYASRVIPVPREVSASCGLACSYPCGDEDAIRKLAGDRNIDVAGYYKFPE
ncbi:DUF3343 domain-containing protein [Synergistaceae bacterium OttesenSCG-928-D05]|nr:DUF3343 domain-containing protein [Synergistaceae bacterium OttesenSCG-928-D05]